MATGAFGEEGQCFVLGKYGYLYGRPKICCCLKAAGNNNLSVPGRRHKRSQSVQFAGIVKHQKALLAEGLQPVADSGGGADEILARIPHPQACCYVAQSIEYCTRVASVNPCHQAPAVGHPGACICCRYLCLTGPAHPDDRAHYLPARRCLTYCG